MDLSAADLEVEARTNEGFIVRDIEVESSVADTSARLIIQDTTMLNVPCEDTNIGLIPLVNRNDATKFFYDTLRKKYPEIPLLKVSEGEKLVITTGLVAGTARLWYTQVEGDDIPKPLDEGGSLSSIKLFVSQSKQNISVVAAGSQITEIVDGINPAGMFQFPFGQDCPANYQMELIGTAIGFANKHADITIDGFRLWHVDKAILGRDEEFVKIESFPFLPNNKDNALFLYSGKEIIKAGDELKTEVKLTNVNVAAQTVDMYFVHIFLQKKVS